MKLNRKWLHEEFVDLSSVSDKEYVEKLTIFGQKVETYERMDAEIKNVVVGKVLSTKIPTICGYARSILAKMSLCKSLQVPRM